MVCFGNELRSSQPFLKSLLNLLPYCFCFMFRVFGPEACWILAPQPRIEPTAPALEGEVLTTGPSGRSLLASIPYWSYHVEIFSPIQCCLFIAVVSFTVQKLLHLIRSHLFIFTFISFTLGEKLKKKNYCLDLCQRVFCLCCSLVVL